MILALAIPEISLGGPKI